MARMIDRLEEARWDPPHWLCPASLQRARKLLADGATHKDLPSLISQDEARRIIRDAERWTDPTALKNPIIASTRGHPVIVADNVVEFCWENVMTSDDKTFGLMDCPNAAPPFQNFWIEARLPQTLSPRLVYHSIGCQVDAITPRWIRENAVAADTHFERLADAHPMAKWILGATVLIEKFKGEIFPLCCAAVAVSEEGRVLGDAELGKQGKEIVSDDTREATRLSLSFLLTAVAFMHCRNVKLESVDPPRQLNKARTKRGHKPLVRYHTLAIEPMKRVLATEGRAGTSGIRQAVHICRGHFKTFTPDKPLLGRHVGTYWWAQQVRGRASEGVVVKDYAPQPREGTKAEQEDPVPPRVWGAAERIAAGAKEDKVTESA